MSFLVKAMRAMTHLNIGAAIAMLVWTLWSGQQIIRGDVIVAPRFKSSASEAPPQMAAQALRTNAKETQ